MGTLAASMSLFEAIVDNNLTDVKESVIEDFERETREGGTVTWEAKD